MTAMLIAAFADGVSVFSGLESLRVKECDRIKAMKEAMLALGGEVSVSGDIMTVVGDASLRDQLVNLKSKILNLKTLFITFFIEASPNLTLKNLKKAIK